MGGFGSGRHKRHSAKATVEESFVLDLNNILREGLHPRTDALTWVVGNAETGSILYFIGRQNGHPTLTLDYSCNREYVRQNIPIIWKPQPYGGVRYWMECPLRNGSVLCRHRCSKLYLPPDGKYFGCRGCYDLSYYSCNTSHKFDRYYQDFVAKYGPYSRKQFNEEFSGKSYYKYFRTRRAAKKWYAKIQTEKAQ